MNKTNKNILIGCPIRNRGWILPRYLNHIEKLQYPKINIGFHFIINDSMDNTKDILEDWKIKHLGEYRYIRLSEVTLGYPPDPGEDSRKRHASQNNRREDWSYHSLSFLRNMLLDLATLDKDTDFLFSVDSDILLTEGIVNRLVCSEKDIVAGMVLNGKEYVHYNFIHNIPFRHDRKYIPGEIFKVKTTGACIMISRKVFTNKNIRYSCKPSGEDEGFCDSAKKEGFDSFVIKDLQEHIMGRGEE